MSKNVNLNADWDGVFNFDAPKNRYNKHVNSLDLFGHLRKNSIGQYSFLYSNEALMKFAGLPANWVWTSTWNLHADDFKHAVVLPGSTFVEYDSPLPEYHPSLGREVASAQYEMEWMLTKGAALKKQAATDGLPFVFLDDCAHRLPEGFFSDVNVPHLVVVPDPEWGVQKKELLLVSEFVSDHS